MIRISKGPAVHLKMCFNDHLMTFFKNIMGNKLETFNGSIYVKVIERGRIGLYNYVSQICVHLTEKMKW